MIGFTRECWIPMYWKESYLFFYQISPEFKLVPNVCLLVLREQINNTVRRSKEGGRPEFFDPISRDHPFTELKNQKILGAMDCISFPQF